MLGSLAEKWGDIVFMLNRIRYCLWWHRILHGLRELNLAISCCYCQIKQFAGGLTWYYLPDQLKYGSQAQVVVFLHGFVALISNLYQTHIEHVVKQGNIVIFPNHGAPLDVIQGLPVHLKIFSVSGVGVGLLMSQVKLCDGQCCLSPMVVHTMRLII